VADAAFTELRFEVAGAVATITLDRPDALNALTATLRAELLAALQRAEADRAVRAIVLTGAGRAFSAGQDLKERLDPDPDDIEDVVRHEYNPIVLALRGGSKPIVGAVNGVAAGAGASLALACDVRVMAEGASFRLAFGRIALVPDTGVTWLLPRLVGAARAAAMMLLDQPLTAADAERLGVVATVVPAGQVLPEATALAERLASFAPEALALTKRNLQRALEVGLEETLDDEAHGQGRAGKTRDHQEGIAAFLEKRTPTFTGE
jgi:2-(1,2-epoxy-1,2-dihydrophenyl)acetyl-CoA isomerase